MANATENQDQDQDQDPNLKADDLDLIDDTLDDEGKDDAALWSEFDQAEAGAAATDDPDSAPPAEGRADEGADGNAADGDGTGARSEADSAADAGDGDPPPDGQSDGGKPSGDADAQAGGDDLFANATPEQRAAHEAAQEKIRKLEQAERSNRGRLSALQRQINQIHQQGSQSDAAASSEAAGGQQGADQGGDGDPAGFLASEDWKGFASEYPEVAGPLEKVIGGMQAEITRQNKELSAIGTERRQSALEEQSTLLVEEHPDWQDAVADSGFVEWLESQPRHIQEAAYRNAQEIVDAGEAADVVGRFKAFRSDEQKSGADASAQRQDTSRADGGDRGNGNQRSGKRQRQLESATAARSRGPGAASGISEDGDPETIWNQFDEMERRQARA